MYTCCFVQIYPAGNFGYVGSLIEYQLKLYEVYLIYTVQISVEL